jgi:hypothetical protein
VAAAVARDDLDVAATARTASSQRCCRGVTRRNRSSRARPTAATPSRRPRRRRFVDPALLLRLLPVGRRPARETSCSGICAASSASYGIRYSWRRRRAMYAARARSVTRVPVPDRRG